MKKLFLAIVFFLLIIGPLAAQTEQGGFFINATSALDLSFLDQKLKVDGNSTDIGNVSNIELSALGGYFVADQFVLGLNLSVQSSTEEDAVDNRSSTTTFTIGPALRYYVINGLFAQGSLGFGTTNLNYEPATGGSEETDLGVLTWGAALGYAFFLSERIAIEPALSYSYARLKDDTETTGGGTGSLITSGVNLSVGFSFIL